MRRTATFVVTRESASRIIKMTPYDAVSAMVMQECIVVSTGIENSRNTV